MTVREALNSALDEEMSADPKVFLMGEEVLLETETNILLFLCLLIFYLFSFFNLFDYLPHFFVFLFVLQVGENQGAFEVRDA